MSPLHQGKKKCCVSPGSKGERQLNSTLPHFATPPGMWHRRVLLTCSTGSSPLVGNIASPLWTETRPSQLHGFPPETVHPRGSELAVGWVCAGEVHRESTFSRASAHKDGCPPTRSGRRGRPVTQATEGKLVLDAPRQSLSVQDDPSILLPSGLFSQCRETDCMVCHGPVPFMVGSEMSPRLVPQNHSGHVENLPA